MRHPRLIPVLLLIIITSLATPLQAQIVLKGKITTEKNEPVAFAPVILQQLPDTTRYTEGVITDMAEHKLIEQMRRLWGDRYQN